MQYHLGGKRHQNAIKFWEQRQEQARLSIFVRGYPNGTTEEELWEYFSQYGRVTKVTIVKPNVNIKWSSLHKTLELYQLHGIVLISVIFL